MDRETGASGAALRRGMLLLAGGDLAGAEDFLRRCLKLKPRCAAACALMASLCELRGKHDAALPWLDRAARDLPGRAWPYALRAANLRRRDKLEEARRDLDAAVKLQPEAPYLLERARLLSDLGHVNEAISDVDRVIAQGGAAELHALRAQFHLQRRNYPEAEADLTRALALAPRDAGLYAGRAELYILTDRLALAQRDLSAALEIKPQDLSLRLARLRLLAQRRRRAQALREIQRLRESGEPRVAAEAVFYRGYLDLQARRPGCGAKDFLDLLSRRPPEDPLAQRARLYWAASKAVDPVFLRRHAMKQRRSAPPELLLCGLGIFPPYTATLEVLHGVSRCDVVFNNVAGPEVRELLAEFCPDIRPASYQAWQDEPRWADAIFKELQAGRRVGFVTRGHPLVFGALACELLRRCAAQKVPVKTFGAVSSLDHLLASAGMGLGDHVRGMQVFDRPAIEAAAALHTGEPLIACFYGGLERRGEVAAFRRSLQRFYPGAHDCLMYGPKYDSPPAKLKLADLERRYPRIHASLMLYVPPRRGIKAPTRASAG